MTSTAARRGRLVDVFPPGFDSKSLCSRGHYCFSPEQFCRALTERYDPERHVESTFVKSVWYGKQEKAARHEFILIEVEDVRVGLTNFIVLDRNTSDNPIVDAEGANLGPIAYHSKSCRNAAQDAFRVSYNGNEKQLLRECKLSPRRYLENIKFSPEEPLFLYELVTLVHVVSEKSPNYILGAENCYWFAGVIWECLRYLRPSGACDDRFAKQRGRFAMLRYTPDEDERDRICNEYNNEIGIVVERLRASRDWGRVNGLIVTRFSSEPPETEPTESGGGTPDPIESSPHNREPEYPKGVRICDTAPSAGAIEPSPSLQNYGTSRRRNSWFKLR